MSNHAKPCPNCGHCPNCGRSNFGPRPWYPYWHIPYTYPQTTWTASGHTISGGTQGTTN